MAAQTQTLPNGDKVSYYIGSNGQKVYTGDNTAWGMPLAGVLPDGSKVYFNPENPSAGYAKVDAGGQSQFSPDGKSWQSAPGTVDLGQGLSDMLDKTKNDYISDASKAVGAATAITGALTPGLYGFGDSPAGAGPGSSKSGGGGGVTDPTKILSTGSKIAGLFDAGQSGINAFGNADAAKAQALTNNRFLTARAEQGGPAADATAFRNAMRASLVSRMDPNAAPISLNGHVLPSLATPDSVDYAKTMFGNLSSRQAAGKTPTEFGVPDPSTDELSAGNTASNLSKVSGALSTGSKIANLLNLFKTNTDTSGGDDGGFHIPGGEFDPNVIYGN